jgi:hypothetical protein
MTDQAARREPPAYPASEDALEALLLETLLLAQLGYRAAGEAADSATLPSLTDFVD